MNVPLMSIMPLMLPDISNMASYLLRYMSKLAAISVYAEELDVRLNVVLTKYEASAKLPDFTCGA
jgi:hypothetical protein